MNGVRMVLCGVALAVLVSAGTAQAGATAINHHPVSTSNRAAQLAFDQGMMLRYAFNNVAAAIAFERAAKLDPHLAMAYWGVALSDGVDINTPPTAEREAAAAKAIGQAKALLPYASPAERDYIEALATRYSDDPKADRAELGVTYHDAMQALAAKYPDDPDVLTLLAESALELQWTFDKGKNDGMAMGDAKVADPTVVPMLRHALAIDPAHLGANHMLIHALDYFNSAAAALPEADYLASQHYVPAASHLAHMASHIYLRVGAYPEALRAGEEALALDRIYIAETPKRLHPEDYYHFHNAMYLAFAALTAGDRHGAEVAAKVLAKTGMPLLLAARFDDWPAVLAAKPPTHKNEHFPTELNLAYHLTRGLAFAAMHRFREAEAERTALAHDSPKIAAGDIVASSADGLSLAYLDAKLALRQGHDDAAIATLKAAIAVEDGARGGELLPFFIPLREALGNVLLAAGRPAEAADAFRDDLTRTLGNPHSKRGFETAMAALGRRG